MSPAFMERRGEILVVLEEVKFGVHLGGDHVALLDDGLDFERFAAGFVELDVLLEKSFAAAAGDGRGVGRGEHGWIFDQHVGMVELHDLFVALVIEVIDVLEKLTFVHWRLLEAAFVA